jgi:hypothetical protein
MLNQGASGVTNGVWESSVRGSGAGAAGTVAPAPPVGRPEVKRSVAATASEQRAVLAQRVDTGRG